MDSHHIALDRELVDHIQNTAKRLRLTCIVKSNFGESKVGIGPNQMTFFPKLDTQSDES